MMKIMTIIGTRPEIIKLSRVINELDKYTDHIIVHSGQNYDYELNEIFFKDLEIRKPDYFLDSAKENAIETIADILVKVNKLILKEHPDAILIYGDTNTCLSVIAAKKNKIPIFHMEAGNRCFDLSVDNNFTNLINSLNKIATHYNKKIIFSTHPRTKNKIENTKNVELHKNIILSKPLGFFDYIKLQLNAYCTLSDSGTITEESSILGFPAITIRNSHERPEGMDEGTLIMSGLNYETIKNSIDIVVNQSKEDSMYIVKDYDTENVSKKIVRCIISYIGYINRNVWKKY
ncbi:UDP-N-acetyl glucosamine 2-epimerase [Paraclostridium bifermentans]